MGIKCLETAVYGACKRIEILSSSLVENIDNNDDSESPSPVIIKFYYKFLDSFFIYLDDTKKVPRRSKYISSKSTKICSNYINNS